MERAVNDPDGYFEAYLRFHRLLFAATGNPFLVSLGQAVLGLLGFAFRLQQHSLIGWEVGLSLHKAVLAAIEACDPERASAAMLALLNRAGNELDEFIGTTAPRRRP
jgi:DNA-binding FadR family transcriptional regulator